MTDMTTIGAIADIFDGPHATPNKTEAGPYFLSITSLQSGRLVLADSAHLSDEDFVRWTKRVTPRENDLLFSYETRLGEAALMPAGIKACLGRRMGLLRPKLDKVDPQFLLYSYLGPHFQHEIVANTIKGATVERISVSEIGNFKIRMPGKSEQQEIAAVLSTLDAKIDLNNRINIELEALTKTIYDYWFVQFDFPDAKGRPYKTSGGKMVWNELLKREIPSGWEARTLSELVSVSTASVDPSAEPGKLFKHLSIPGLDATGFFRVESGADIGSNKFSVAAYDLLVSKLNPWFNRVFADTGHDDLICSTEFVVWRCATMTRRAYLHSVATSPRFIAYCTGSATGTSNSHKRVNPQVMMRFLVPYAAQQATAFGDLAAPILEQCIRNTQQNRELTHLRDWLLPLLMNGQVTPSGMYCAADKAA